MDKEKLKQLGFTDEQIAQILKEHNEAIKDKFVPKHRFDEVNTEKKNVEDQLKDRDNQIKDLSKFKGTAEELQTKVSDLEKKNQEKEAEFKKELEKTKIDNAMKIALQGKVHDIDLVSGLINREGLKLDEKGELAGGFQEQVDKLKESKAFLFLGDKDNKGNPGWKPAGKPPQDGKGSEDDDSAESFAKKLAASKTSTDDSANKAAEHYFK